MDCHSTDEMKSDTKSNVNCNYFLVQRREKVRNISKFLYAVLVTPDDNITVIPYPKRTADQLDELHWMEDQVKGKVEMVDGLITGSDTAMIVNEQGKILGLPHNDTAQALLVRQTDYIVGNALILCAVGEELTGFTREEAEAVSLVIKAEKERLGKYF